MAMKLWKKSGRDVTAGGVSVRADRWSVTGIFLAAALLLVLTGPMTSGIRSAYGEANAAADESQDPANAQPADDSNAGQEQPAQQDDKGQAGHNQEQPPADQPPEAQPSQPLSDAEIESMTQEQIDAEAEKLIRELDEELARNPQLAQEVQELERHQGEEEMRRAARLRNALQEATQQRERESDIQRGRGAQPDGSTPHVDDHAAEEAAQRALQEQEARQAQELDQAAQGEAQPVPPPSRSRSSRHNGQRSGQDYVPPRPDRRGNYMHAGPENQPHPVQPVEQPVGEVPAVPAAQAPQPGAGASPSHPRLNPVPDSPKVPDDGPAVPPPPDNMKLNANNLPDVSDAELEAMRQRIATSGGPSGTTAPAGSVTPRVPQPAAQPSAAAPTRLTPGQGLPRDGRTGTPDLRSQPKWWVLKAEERPYFFTWKNTPFEKCCQDLAEMTGLSVKGLNLIPANTAKPLTFQSVRIMDYDEALLTFNRLVEDQEYWVLRRDQYLEVRQLAEWFRYITPSRMFGSVEEYRKAKAPVWDLVSVIYEPKNRSAAALQSGVVSMVPVNATRVSILPNTNLLELKSFVYYLDMQLEYLKKVDVPEYSADGRELKKYALKHVSPDDAARLLRLMLPPPETVDTGSTPATPQRVVPGRGPTPAPSATPGPGGSLVDTVEITEDNRLSQLTVRATAAKHKLVEEYLSTYIDLPLEDGQSELIKLTHADPSEVVEMVRPMLQQQQVIQPRVPTPPQPGQPPQPQPPQPVRVNQPSATVMTPIGAMRAILVKAKPDDMALIKKFVEMLDVPGPDAKHHYITLQHGNASGIASVLNDALGGGSSSYRRGTPGGSQARQDFKAIPDLSSDQALIIMGETKDVEDAKALIAKLDVDPQAGASQHLVHLKNVTPSSVTSVLQTRFGGTGGGGGYSRGRHSSGSGGGSSLPQFIAGDESKTLIVVCPDKDWPGIEGLIKELDDSAEVANTTKIFRLKHVGAPTLANVLTQSFGQGRSGYSRYGTVSSSGPTFQYEQEGNVLLVTANEETHAKVAEMVTQLDQPTASDKAELRVIDLKSADAEYVADKLEDLLSGDRGGRSYSRYGGGGAGAPKAPVQIVAESVGNRILMTSSEEDFKKAEALAAQIDKEYAAQEIVRRTFTLQYVQPMQIQAAIETMFASRSSGGSGRYSRHYGGGSSSSTPGAIKVMDVGNGLIVMAPKAKMEEIATLIQTLDTDPASKNEIRTYKVENAGRSGTAELARNLEQLHSSGAGGGRWGGGSASSVKFIGSYGSDLLMVSAPAERMEEVAKRVEEVIKSQTGEDLTLVIKNYDIKQATAQDVAEMIEPILQAKYQELQSKSGGPSYGYYGGQGGPQVTAHKTGSRILLAAPKPLIPLAEQLIAEFDKPAAQSTMVIVSLSKGSAEEIAQVVQQQMATGGGSMSSGYGGYPSYRRGYSRYSPYSGGMSSSSGSDEVTIIPVESSRLVIVKGSEEKVAQAQKLIKELDDKARPDGPMIKVYDLKYADTYDVTSTLEEIVGTGSSSGYGSSSYSSGYGSSGYGSSYGSSGYGRRTSSGYGGGSSGSIVIQTEGQNRIIVSAPADKIPLIEEVIELKERLAEEASKSTADAGAKGEILSRDPKEGSITKAYEVKGSSDDVAQYLDKILVDRYGYFDSPYVKSFPFANQVIVTGKPEQFKEVERWLEKLENTKLPTRVGLVFKRVKSGDAGKIVEMLKQYAPSELQDKINVAAMPRLSARKSALEQIKEINYDDPIYAPVEGTEKPLSAAPFVAPNAAARIGESIASLRWAQGVKVTVATQPANAAAAAAPATQPVAAPSAPAGQIRKVIPLRHSKAEDAVKVIKGYVEKAASEGNVSVVQLQRLVSVEAGSPGKNELIVTYDPRVEMLVNNMVSQLDQAPATQPDPVKVTVAPPAATQPAAVKVTVAPPAATQPVAAAPAPAPVKPVAAAPEPAKVPATAAPVAKPVTRVAQAPVPAPAPAAAPDLPNLPEMPVTEEMDRDEQARLEIQRAAMQAYTTQETQIKYDEENGLIYMVGPANDLDKLEEVLRQVADQFEELGATDESNVRVFQLKYVDPTFAQAVLEEMFNDKVQGAAPRQPGNQPAKAPGATTAKPGEKDKSKTEDEENAPGAKRREQEEMAKAEKQAHQPQGGQRIRVFPNTRDQTLVIRAAKEDFSLIAELLLKIDRPTLNPPVDIQIFQLKNLNAMEVEEAIKTILKIDSGLRRGTVRRPMVGRSLVGGRMGMDSMLDQLEQEMLELETAGLLGGLEQPAQPAQGGKEGSDKGTMKLNPAKDITIASDATTNSILVMAPQEGMKLVRKLIEKLEEQDIPTKIQPFQLKYADATKVGGEIEKLFQSQGGGGRGAGGRSSLLGGFRPSALGTITVASDARTNTIVVRALAPDMEKVKPIVDELDRPPSDVKVVVYSIEHSDAKQLLLVLQQIFVQDSNAVGSRAVKISADAETNSIVVSAPDDRQKEIAAQIKELDARAESLRTPKQIQLAVANPSVVATKLIDIFVGKRGGRAGKNEITIVGDDSSKMLFVTAPSEVYTKIEELAKMMDKSATQDIRVFALKHATATDMLARFKEMMGQIFAMGGGKNISDMFAATADELTNSLIVAGTPAVFQAVEKVLKDIDAPPPPDFIITSQMFPLTRGNAASLAATINAMFASQPRTRGALPPRASAEPVSNVLYITGTKGQIDQIQASVIDPLEKYEVAALNNYQIPIKYAKADEVAATLNSMFTTRFAAMKAAGDRTKSPAEMVVNIVPEPASKQLLVSCTEANKKVIDELLVTLDSKEASDLGQQVKVIPVKFADLGYAVQALTVAFTKTGRVPDSEKITILPEYGTQSVVIKARGADLAEVEKLLAKIDNSDNLAVVTPETLRLKFARASEVAAKMTDMISRAKRRDRTTGQFPVSVTGDDTSNTLLVTANSKKEMDEAKGLVQQLDTQPAMDTERELKSYPIQFADMTSLTQAITLRFKDNEKRPIQEQVSITPDAVNSSMMITASPANHAKVAAIIKELDQSNMARVPLPKTVKLQFARASEVARTMTGMITLSKRRDRVTGMYPITVTGDDTSNTLIVTASETDMKEAEQLIAQLDTQPAMDTERELKSYPIQFADMTSLTQAITLRFKDNEKRPIQDQVSITPDAVNSAMMITASPANHAKVAAIIRELDQSNMARVPLPKTVKLQFAKASEVARTMTGMITLSKRRDRVTGMYPITVTGDDTSNTLIVTASETDMKEAEQLIAQLDIEPPKEMDRQLKSYVLKFADLGSVVTAINTRFADTAKLPIRDQVSLTADYANNALLVTASLKNQSEVKLIVDELDKSDVTTMRVPETIKVQNMKASDLATTLNQMIRTSKKVDKRTGQYPVTVSANDASNTLLVTANVEDMKETRDLIAKLDLPMEEGDQRLTKPYAVRYVDMTAVVAVINQRFDTSNRSRSAKEQVQAFPEAATNSVIVTATPANHEVVATLIKQLDVESAGTVQPEIIRLTNARAEDLATVVRSTYQTRKLRAGEQPPMITPESNSNSLVVSASQYQMTAIKELISELDKPVDPTRVEEMRVIPLQYADATEAKTILSEYLRPPGVAPGRGTGELMNGIRLQASPTMNALVVSGTTTAIERVQQLVQTMDKQELMGSSEVPQIVEVKHTSASQLASTLSRMFTEPAQRSARGAKGAEQVPIIMADEATNTLVVKARLNEFNNIKETAAKLDTERTGPSGIEVIPVRRGTDVAGLARELERTINQGEQLKLRQQPGYRPAAVSIGVDERTPALILAGSPELFATVKELVSKLQTFRGEERPVTARIVPVKNMPAQDLKRVIQQMIEQQQGQSATPQRRR